FGELLELFGVQRVVYKIDAFEPLPDLGQQFDWITAFSTNFYLYHPAKKRWETAEWDFFVRDLQHHLAQSGKIFLGLNPLYNGGYYTAEIRDLFFSRGADVERERIFFENGVRFGRVASAVPQRTFTLRPAPDVCRRQRTLQRTTELPSALQREVRGSDDVASADVALLFASAFDAVHR